jgi:hypothetical protein
MKTFVLSSSSSSLPAVKEEKFEHVVYSTHFLFLLSTVGFLGSFFARPEPYGIGEGA